MCAMVNTPHGHEPLDGNPCHVRFNFLSKSSWSFGNPMCLLELVTRQTLGFRRRKSRENHQVGTSCGAMKRAPKKRGWVPFDSDDNPLLRFESPSRSDFSGPSIQPKAFLSPGPSHSKPLMTPECLPEAVCFWPNSETRAAGNRC